MDTNEKFKRFISNLEQKKLAKDQESLVLTNQSEGGFYGGRKNRRCANNKDNCNGSKNRKCTNYNKSNCSNSTNKGGCANSKLD